MACCVNFRGRFLVGLFLAGGLVLSLPASSSAQSGGLFGGGSRGGGSGNSGGTGTATSLTPMSSGQTTAGMSTGGGSQQFGGSSQQFGGQQQGQGGQQSGFNTGSGTLGQTNLNMGDGSLSETIGNGFVGRSDNMGRFVGQSVIGAAGPGSQGMSGANFSIQGLGPGFQGLGGRSQQGFGGRGFGSGSESRPQVRPQMRIDFNYPQAAAGEVQTRLRDRLDAVPLSGSLSGVQTELDADGTLTLRGQVADRDTAKLMETMSLLEPGVYRVNNQLSVPGSE